MNNIEATRLLYKSISREIAEGKRKSFAPLVSMFGIGQKDVMTLEKHYQLLPLYMTVLPPRMLLMIARQLGKTTNVCTASFIRSATLPFYHTVILQPRFEQIQRMNAMTYKPIGEACRIRKDFITSVELDRLALKKFHNGSLTLLSHLFLSPDKLRGISACAHVIFDECLRGISDVTTVEYEQVTHNLRISHKKVQDIKSGEICVSFIDNNICCAIVSKDAQYRGNRGCYRITTRSGRSIDATINHALPTNFGRLKVKDIIEYGYKSKHRANRTAEERNSVISDGEQEFRGFGGKDQGYPMESWSEATRVCASQIYPIIECCYKTTLAETESRLRGYLVSIDPECYENISLLVYPNTSKWVQNQNDNRVVHGSDNPLDSPGSPEETCRTEGFLDPIVNIEYIGEHPVYDIEVEGTHNYVLANGICSYNCQDINRDFIPIVAETMSATEHWGSMTFTGTPNTTDTTLGLEWEDCSQAEWIIKCPHCNYYNIPNPVFDLVKMIGKYGCICAKCGRPLDPIVGQYVHAFPDRRFSYPGYHISQTIHPMHCMNRRKWPAVLKKVETYGERELYNEVFGWPYDTSVVPLTRKDVLASRNRHTYEDYLDIPYDLREEYRYISVGIDWDGGGALSQSFTNIAVCGLRKDSNVIDCIYGERVRKGQRAKEVSDHVVSIVERVRPDILAYDAGGSGFLYRQNLLEAGMNDAILMPFKYSSPSSGDVINFHPGQRDDNSYYYTIDKSRSLAILIEAVKNLAVTNPNFDEKDQNAVPWELLSLIEMPKETPTGGTIYLIGRKSGVPDDYAHALNFACSAIWDHFRNYPKLGQRYDTSKMNVDRTPSVENELWGDPNDWKEFIEATNGPLFTSGGF